MEVISENITLQKAVNQAIENYFEKLGNTSVNNLYELFLSEVEEPLLKVVLKHVYYNQSKAAILLGLSRGTLRKKLLQYQIIS